ncbi:MAG: methylmalonyl-CoA mutase family protein [Bacteroidales bacterium]
MNNQNKNLFQEFPPVQPEQWEKKITEDLKGADYEKKLVWKPNEGFKVKPYYVANDLKKLEYLAILPDTFPFVRSSKKTDNTWFIRQDILVSDLKRTNEKALDILMKGIDSLGFILEEDEEYSKEDLDLLLKNIFAEMVEINFHCGRNATQLMKNHYEMLVRYNRDFQKIHGSLDFDPFGRLITKGNFYFSKEEDLQVCHDLIKTAEYLPHFTVINVSGDHFHHAGATIVEELAFSLASGAEYLTQLTETGLSVSQVAPKIRFRFATGSNYFMEIAKYRAARLLWAHIVKAYGPSSDEAAKMTIHAVTSCWNKAMYDPYVNMLRTTTEAMSAIISGIDSLTVGPFNEVFEKPNDFSERIARNQQLLLREESYLDKVIDPAAGSYYIENLTDSIAAEAWKLFLETDAMGGYLEAVRLGEIQKRISETAQKRDMDLAGRKDIILGVNQYPNFAEKREEDLPAVIKAANQPEPGAGTETLKIYRGAMAFEELRLKTDLFAKAHKRPAAFMFTYGNLAMRVARSQFGRNFFACAGFETIDNLGFKTAEEGVEAFLASKAEILVICSADEEYPVIAPVVKEMVKDQGVVVIAGYPKDTLEELRAKGIAHFIHIRSNVLEELKKFQGLLGI